MSRNRVEGSRILITGGTGFVGTHLIDFLGSRASDVAVLAPGMPLEPNPEVCYYEADIRDRELVGSIVREFRPTHVYHLAAISAFNRSCDDPRLTFEVNVIGTYNVFEAAMGLTFPARILNVSTSQVYARSNDALREESPLGPETPYAASKAAAELFAVQYSKGGKGGGIITARSFNHTGPGQPPTFVLSSFAKQFAEIESGVCPPRISVGNLHVKRDFSDVRDVVAAYDVLHERGRAGETYNVCSGSAVLLADVIEMLQRLVKLEVTVDTDSDKVRSDEAVQILGDSSKIKTETGWYPQIPLRKTVEDLLNYWRSQCTSVVPA